MEIVLDTVSYKQDGHFKLKDISYSFCTGQIYGIIGNNGSGKSYVGKLLSGNLIQTSGEIFFNQFILKSYSNHNMLVEVQKKVGYVPENLENYFTGFTVYEELKVQILRSHYREEESEKRIYDALKMVGLSKEILSLDPFNLSTGEQKKLALAIALLHNPEVLVLDEPTLGLDSFEQKKLHKLLRMLKNRYHKLIIIMTNDLEFLNMIVDTLLVLEHGTLVLDGKKNDVLKETRRLKKLGIDVPTTIYVADYVLRKKNIKLGYRDQINDLIKDIYRFSEWEKKGDKNDA